MDNFNNKQESCLLLIDNVGFNRSVNLDSTFHCFIKECGFDTMNINDLMTHLVSEHCGEKWSGFCYACNSQIQHQKVDLLKEVLHMTLNGFHETAITLIIQPRTTIRAAAIAAKEKIAAIIKSSDDSSDSVDDNLICLKPWTKRTLKTLKTQANCKRMLELTCLYALYKCMGIDCAFATTGSQKMLTHLQCKEESSTSRITNSAEVTCSLECAYCDKISDGSRTLVDHIRDEHSSSVYQCPYCFYRSVAACNVVRHLDQFHKFSEKKVLICNGRGMLLEAEKASIEKYREKNVHPLSCSACGKTTFLLDVFINHLKTSPNHYNKHFECQYCLSNILVSEAMKHLLLHQTGVYQCLYCPHGANDIPSIQKHMCNIHSTKLLFICVRLNQKHRSLSDEQLGSIESTTISQLGELVDEELFERCPYSDTQLKELLDPPTTSFTETLSDSFYLTNDCQLTFDDVLSYYDLEKYYSSHDWNQRFAGQFSSPLIDVTEDETDAFAENLAESKIAVHDSVQDADMEDTSNDVHSEIEHSACNLLEGTALEGAATQSEVPVVQNTQLDSNTFKKPATFHRVKSEEIEEADINVAASHSNETEKVANLVLEWRHFPENVVKIVKSDDNFKSKTAATEQKTNPKRRGREKQIPRENKTHDKSLMYDVQANVTTNLTKLSQAIKYKCAFCPESSCGNPKRIYEHWKEKHEPGSRQPFLFEIRKIFQCFYCRQCNSYDDLKNHSKKNHTNKIFAFIDNGSPNKCGVCFHQFNDLEKEIVDHFKDRHNNDGTNITISLENYLTDELLDQILAESTTFAPPQDNAIEYRCSECNKTRTDESEMLAHIRTHILQRLNSPSLIKAHNKEKHKEDSETNRNVDVIETLDKYLKMKIVFPNGLMLTKKEAKNTQFGRVQDLKKVLNDKDLEAVRQRQENEKISISASVKQIQRKSKRK